MSRAFLQYFERELKGRAKAGEEAVQEYLLAARKQPRQVYPQLVRALSRSLPKIEISLHKKGRKEFRDLWWRFSGTPGNFVDEVAFAIEWFREITPLINEFRSLARQIESLVLSSEAGRALHLIREHRREFGWTVWGLELELAIMVELEGSAETKRYLTRLMETSTPRLASLMATILGDRCDESISIGAFVAKCDRSFPNVRLPQQIQEYLYYRAYGYLRDIEEAAPSILAMSSVNSFIDHYEALVDIFAAIVLENKHSEYLPLVKESCGKLIEIGIEDFRIKKLYWIAGGNYEVFEERDHLDLLGNIISEAFFDYGAQPSDINDTEFIQCLVKEISQVNCKITSLQLESDQLFAKGLRYRGLGFGLSIAGFANRVARFSEDFISSPWGIFNSRSVNIGNILSLDLNSSFQMITESHRCVSGFEYKKRAELLVIALDSTHEASLLPLTDIEILWVARQLLRLQNFNQLDIVMSVISSRHSIRAHKKSALQALWLIGIRDLLKAIQLMADALIENVGNRRELPLELLFKKARWSDLKETDVIAVGIVAHHANLLLDDQDTRYIVRMACRSFHKTKPISDEMTKHYLCLDDVSRVHFIEFLREVWVEDNLAMAGFQSTQEVREDRIQVLQVLLQIDENNSSVYRDEIRELTFEQNLWKGLKHINETRIFVNEAAIARWAEKELAHEFQRWQKLKLQDQSTTPLVDEMVLKYLVPDNVEGIFAKFPKIGLTEADTVLMNLVERLLGRFLMDPTDGLNCYLSSRIRHGTLKGTLLGPLEEAGVVGQADSALKAEPAIKAISADLVNEVIVSIRHFEMELTSIVDRLIKKDVQIRGTSAPEGRIYAYLSPEFGFAPIVSLAENLQFSSFVPTCFELFWSVLSYSLADLTDYVRNNVKMEIQSSFDKLIEKFSGEDESLVGLISTLRTVATATQAQCDLVSDWFSPNRSLQQQEFSLLEAVEIARKTTKNVYRLFPDEISIINNEFLSTPLTPLGLSAITDCLYVLFENAWKHSGLGADLDVVYVDIELNDQQHVLKLAVSHALSDARFKELENGALEKIRDIYIANADMLMAALEGGSGIAKIVRYTRNIDRVVYPEPVTICLTDTNNLAVTVHLPIFDRDGAYDAYFE